MRAVVDPNVLIASLLSRSGAPAQIVSRWLAGEFELVLSERLLAELERALAYPKVRTRIAADEARAFVELLRQGVLLANDAEAPARRSSDPGDDYLLALAEQERAFLVSGDRDLLALAGELPILAPRAFLDALAGGYHPAG
ncbi:MAG TPA: putative toxin-antitoxin system toxin component, PIN family [Gaiellaceae bacterium]|nr:putative toxin-antitoxin system toxin component, PIN family [Gaiellaceae bacterium]